MDIKLLNIFIHILHNFWFVYFIIGDSTGHNVSGDVHTEVCTFNKWSKWYTVLVIVCIKHWLHLLTKHCQNHKNGYDQVMKIILHLRGCDIFVRCLFNNMRTPKSGDVDVVKIIGKESFTTNSSRILHANIEIHETKSVNMSCGYKGCIGIIRLFYDVWNVIIVWLIKEIFWYKSVKNTWTKQLWISCVEKNVAKH